jgi:hypothetical protein
MALEEKLKQEQPEESMGNMTDDEEQDLEIAVLLGKRLIADGGSEVIAAAQKSSDPAQVIGQFLMQLGSQLVEKMPEEMKPSPKLVLASGGWLEQMSDFLQEEYDVSREVADRAEIYVASSAKSMADAKQQGAGAGAPTGNAAPAGAAPAAPPMPGGM